MRAQLLAFNGLIDAAARRARNVFRGVLTGGGRSRHVQWSSNAGASSAYGALARQLQCDA